MTPKEGGALVRRWLDLLKEVDSVSLDCQLEPEEIETRLARRQQAIDGIQQLDTPLRKLAALRKGEWKNQTSVELDQVEEFLNDGREICERIRRQDMELVKIAKEKRLTLLGQLKRNTLLKGYRASMRSPKIRPPVILDSRA